MTIIIIIRSSSSISIEMIFSLQTSSPPRRSTSCNATTFEVRDSKGENTGKCGGDDAEDEEACEAFLEFVARVPGGEEVDAGCLEGGKGRGGGG